MGKSKDKEPSSLIIVRVHNVQGTKCSIQCYVEDEEEILPTGFLFVLVEVNEGKVAGIYRTRERAQNALEECGE